MAEERGKRFNSGKLRYDLISPIALEFLAQVYTHGVEKYGDRNWEKGLPLMDCYASMMRHMQKWMMGENLDPDSSLPHMAHAMWNAAAILHLSLTHPEMDDRPMKIRTREVPIDELRPQSPQAPLPGTIPGGHPTNGLDGYQPDGQESAGHEGDPAGDPAAGETGVVG